MIGFVYGSDQVCCRVSEDWGLECEKVERDIIGRCVQYEVGDELDEEGACKSSMACVLESLVATMISVMRTNPTNDREITRTWIPKKMEQWSLKEQRAEDVSLVSHTALERNHHPHRQIWWGASIASPSCAYIHDQQRDETRNCRAHIPY